jgi:hypothetical protein
LSSVARPKIIARVKDNEPLINRAFAAYFREAAREGAILQPASTGHLCEFRGKRYVVLGSGAHSCRVYRVRNDGGLKGLKRWPREIGEKQESVTEYKNPFKQIRNTYTKPPPSRKKPYKKP